MCEETEAREILVKVNAGAPLVERTDDLGGEPVVFVQIPVAVEAVQAGFLAGYESARATVQPCPICDRVHAGLDTDRLLALGDTLVAAVLDLLDPPADEGQKVVTDAARTWRTARNP